MRDPRFDTRTKKEFIASVSKWEPREPGMLAYFTKRYIGKYGGTCESAKLGFGGRFEENYRNTSSEPDYVVVFTAGPMSKSSMVIEIQGMEPDRKKFHLKLSKVHKALKRQSWILHCSAYGLKTERYTLLGKVALTELLRDLPVVPHPGTVGEDYPEGKPALCVDDRLVKWF